MFDPDQNIFENIKGLSSLLSENSVSASHLDQAGNVWIGLTNGELAQYSSSLQRVRLVDKKNSEAIVDIISDAKSIIFANGSGDLFIVDPRDLLVRKLDMGKECDNINSIVVEIALVNQDELWIGTRGRGIYTLDRNTLKCSTFTERSASNSSLALANIHQIFHDALDATTWLATDQGLYGVDEKNQVVHFSSQNSNLVNSEVVSITRTKDGHYWIGTFSGLNSMVPTEFEFYDRSTDKDLHSIVAIDTQENIGTIIATYNGLLYREHGSFQYKSIREIFSGKGLINDKIMSLHVDKNGIWVGYRSSGVQFFSIPKKTVETYGRDKPRKISSDAVSAILTTLDGVTLIGTYGGGLNIIRSKSVIDLLNVGNNKIVMLHQTSDGKIWIATESGLFLMNDLADIPNRINFSPMDYKTNPVVWNMRESPSGETWFGTMHHGLFVLSKEDNENALFENISQVQTYSESLHTIYSIEIDSTRNVWFSTNSGLYRLNPTTKEQNHISLHHGLPNIEFDFAVSHKDRKGSLYFGGGNGYTKFEPDEKYFELASPIVVITKLFSPNLNLNQISDLKTITAVELSHNDYFITLEFSVLDFLDPEKNLYRYQLNGFDPDWVESGHRNTATYTNLPAGKYTFTVQGANSAGIWNREGVALEILVLPAPWRTWWAYCLYSIAVLSALLAYRKYDRNVLLKEQAVSAADDHQRVADQAQDELLEQQELQDHLVQALHQHNLATLGIIEDSIRSTLTAPDAGNIVDKNQLRLQALAILETCLYQQNEVLVADLHQYTDRLFELLLRYSPIATESLITINDVTQQYIESLQATPLAIIIFELLQNSIQYAFEKSQGSCIVQIQLWIEPPADSQQEQYALIVQDNGNGVPAGVDPFHPSAPGLKLVHDLAEKTSASIEISSDSGTTITLLIPVTS